MLFTFSGWLLGLFFLIGALVSLNHPLMALLFGFLGFILLPPGHRWIEKKLRFRFKTKIKLAVSLAILIITMPLSGYYSGIDKQTADQLQLTTERTEKEKAAVDRKTLQLKDSLNFYVASAGKLTRENKTGEAIKKLDRALAFAASQADRALLSKERSGILAANTLGLVKAGKYKAAIPELTLLIQQDPNNAAVLYNRAVCYSHTGQTQEAVTDLKAAMQVGSAEAGQLHEKINPIRKKVAYYVTLCCDGTTSGAKGRGACSHHGGVCNWNDPVYEEYRKYE